MTLSPIPRYSTLSLVDLANQVHAAVLCYPAQTHVVVHSIASKPLASLEGKNSMVGANPLKHCCLCLCSAAAAYLLKGAKYLRCAPVKY